MIGAPVGLFWSSLFAKSCRFMALAAVFCLMAGAAEAATVVALGASNTYGKGVARNEAYPAQLQAILKARGLNVRVVNAGINGDTTGGMLRRLNGVTPKGTDLVILQPGGNDARRGQGASREANIAEIKSRLSARGIKVIVMENNALRGLPHQPDGQHLTPEGYRMLAQSYASDVARALGQ